MSKFFINRPIVAIVISILMVLVGLVSLLSLPTAQFPNIADPMIQVKATYPGADATTIAESVATPIEQQMSGVSGMNYMYSLSASSGGGMTLYVDYQLGTDINSDQILAQMRSGQANSQLPAEVNQQGVLVQPGTTAPFMLLDLFSDSGAVRQYIPGQLRHHQFAVRAHSYLRSFAGPDLSAQGHTPCAFG